jgi:uncharacterized iron-regulated membrane protein
MRSLHYWLAPLVALPFGITLLTGILLSTREFNTSLQHRPVAVASPAMQVSFAEILKNIQSDPALGVSSWADVPQIDIRPHKGQIRVRTKADLEIQVDPSTGKVLQVSKRRVSWLISIHEGAIFGAWVRYGVFFTSALLVLVLYVSGVWLFWRRFRGGWKRRIVA